MHPLIEEKREEIAALCRHHHVLRLDVFGSAARGDFHEATSDFDFLVEFAAMPPVAHKRGYFSVLQGLEDILKRKVDLVEPDAIRNALMRMAITATKRDLYAA